MKLQINLFRSGGFTLLEMMAAIAMLAFLLVMAIPSMQDARQRNRISSSTNEFVAALHLARIEALKRREQVVLCASDVEESSPSCGTDWSKGWIVITQGGELLRLWQPQGDGLGINGYGEFEVRYTANGWLSFGGTAPQKLEIRTPGCKGPSARMISIQSAGSVSVKDEDC